MSAKKAEDSSKSKEKDKVFDVAKPGETAATATARPIIVGHGSGFQQDPMVKTDEVEVKDDQTNETPEPASAPVLNEKKIIKPINIPTAEEDKKASKEEHPKPDEPQEADKEEEEEPEKESSDDSNGGAVDALAQEVSTKKEAAKADEEAKKKQAEIDKLIDSKKYIVPVGEEAHHKSNTMAYLLLLVVILGLIIINFAIDAEVIDLGVNALTDVL